MTFSQPDITRIAEILAEAARVEIMPRFKALAEGDIRHKSSVFDPVIAADVAAERAISAQLRASFPGALGPDGGNRRHEFPAGTDVNQRAEHPPAARVRDLAAVRGARVSHGRR